MIYQDVYSQIQPVNMFGAIQEAKQARDLEQQRQNTLANQALANQQKAFEQKQRIATTLFKSANKFANLPDDQRASSWQSYRSQWVSYLPEANGILPNVWDPKDQANNQQLKGFIEYLSDFVPEETKTLAQGEVLVGLRGGQSRVIAQGMPKEDSASAPKVRLIETADKFGNRIFVPAIDRMLPDKSLHFGDVVFDAKNNYSQVSAAEYFSKHPEQNVGSQPIDYENIPSKINATPKIINNPSPTNQSGETNQVFPIDMSMAAPGQPTNALAVMNMPTGGMAPPAAPVAPPVNAMAVPFAGGMGMALPVDIQQVTQAANMLAQEQGQPMPPNRFAQLRPAGSAPSRFGSPGVEGMEFAYQPSQSEFMVKTPQGMAYRAAPPAGQQARETFRDMTPEEIRASGRDPARFSGQVSSLGQKKFEALPSATAAELESVQLESAKIQLEAQKQKLKEEQKKAKKEQQEAVSLLRGIKRIESALFELQSNPLFDTGTIDQFFMSKTDAGKKLLAANAAILPSVKSEGRVAGEGAFSDFDAKLLIQRLPTMANPMSSNWETINQLKTDVLAAYGVQAAVSNKAERDALPPGTIYVDINTGIKYQKGEK